MGSRRVWLSACIIYCVQKQKGILFLQPCYWHYDRSHVYADSVFDEYICTKTHSACEFLQ